MRTPIIAGNWKLNKTISEAVALTTVLKASVADVKDVEIIVCTTVHRTRCGKRGNSR